MMWMQALGTASASPSSLEIHLAAPRTFLRKQLLSASQHFGPNSGGVGRSTEEFSVPGREGPLSLPTVGDSPPLAAPGQFALLAGCASPQVATLGRSRASLQRRKQQPEFPQQTPSPSPAFATRLIWQAPYRPCSLPVAPLSFQRRQMGAKAMPPRAAAQPSPAPPPDAPPPPSSDGPQETNAFTPAESVPLKTARAPVRPTLRVASAGGHVSEILEIESQRPSLRVLVVLGNPGVVAFYEDFVAELWEGLEGRATVTAISHLGHTEQDWEKGRLFSLADQIAHKVKYVEEQIGHRDASEDLPWVLVGHSIGAHIAMEVYKVFGPTRVRHVVGLYPFVTVNEQSRWQRVLDFASHRWTLGVVLSGAAGALGRLPRALSRALVQRTLGAAWSEAAVDVLCRYLLQYGVTRNYGFMGMTEFDTLEREPEWESLRSHHPQLSFLFGEDDHWGPLALMDKMAAEVPALQVAVEREGHLHAFCCTPEGSRWVARHCARTIQELPGLVSG